MSGKRVSFILIAISLVLLVIFLGIVFTSDATTRLGQLMETAKTILQLLLIDILGAFASFLFTQYSTERDQQLERREREKTLQEARHKSRLEALNKLTTLYWGICKAFDIIAAHRSAKSYGEQTRQIIEYR